MSELDELEVERPAGEAGTEPTVADVAPETRDATEAPGAVPYQRFKEVNDRDKQYRKFGKPDELEARLSKLSEYEAKEAEHQAEQQRLAAEDARKANPKQAEVDDLIKESFERQYPGLPDVASRQREQERIVAGSYVQRAFERIPQMLRDHGVDATPDAIESYEGLIEAQILKDATLTKSFWKPAEQNTALDEAFTRVKTKYINPALQAAGARTLDQARERRSRTIDRAAPSGTARVKPTEFQSKHPKGSAAHDRDRAAYRDAQMDAFLDASDFDGEGGVAL